jgi:hypothetical protein
MEHIRQQRRAQHLAHLCAVHAGLQRLGLFGGDRVTLHDLDPVRRDDTEETVGVLQRRLAAGDAEQRKPGRAE